jgi:hypothetical protein
MSTPDIGKLDLSDSDTDDLFASPSKASKPATKPNSKPEGQRNGESKYDAEEAREAALKKELEGVRSINEVIEGVVSSLECAKGNMEVCSFLLEHSRSSINKSIDRLKNRHISLNPPKYLDPYPLSNRTQPTPNLESQLARRKPRHHRYGERSSAESSSC